MCLAIGQRYFCFIVLPCCRLGSVAVVVEVVVVVVVVVLRRKATRSAKQHFGFVFALLTGFLLALLRCTRQAQQYYAALLLCFCSLCSRKVGSQLAGRSPASVRGSKRGLPKQSKFVTTTTLWCQLHSGNGTTIAVEISRHTWLSTQYSSHCTESNIILVSSIINP